MTQSYETTAWRRTSTGSVGTSPTAPVCITFNEEKFSFERDELECLGFKLTKDSVEPHTDMLKTIAEFPEPKDITRVRSWFGGLTNQVDCFQQIHTIM